MVILAGLAHTVGVVRAFDHVQTLRASAEG